MNLFRAALAASLVATVFGTPVVDNEIFATAYDIKVSDGGKYGGMYITPGTTDKPHYYVATVSPEPAEEGYYLASWSDVDALIWHDSKTQVYTRIRPRFGIFSQVFGNGPMPLQFVPTGTWLDNTRLKIKNNELLLVGQTSGGQWHVCNNSGQLQVIYNTRKRDSCDPVSLTLQKRI
ncbi:hypothetical protein TRICI_006883 [Trichomonascus ciferrii]|uniref:Uncharacterized protein n=1 Tax=Trichomonascus ciferrii TaxID=44093 RepID=A0A6A1LJM1_9ASCO|nr:hypothetical protein TRICI_006883 [Trichomonascus ciferrii]